MQAPADMSVSELAADKLIRELSGTLPVFARPVFEKLLTIVARNGLFMSRIPAPSQSLYLTRPDDVYFVLENVRPTVYANRLDSHWMGR